MRELSGHGAPCPDRGHGLSFNRGNKDETLITHGKAISPAFEPVATPTLNKFDLKHPADSGCIRTWSRSGGLTRADHLTGRETHGPGRGYTAAAGDGGDEQGERRAGPMAQRPSRREAGVGGVYGSPPA